MAQKAVREEDCISQDVPQPSLRRNSRAKPLALETERPGEWGRAVSTGASPQGEKA